jgi:rsbT antagonist protein RsbS
MEEKKFTDLSIHISQGCLVVPIQGDIDDERMKSIQKQILEGVENSGVKGVVIDVSGVRLIEPYHARIIDNTAKMIYLLGAKTVLTGMKPGVAISLTDSNFDFKEIYETAGTFEEGVKKLQGVIAIGEDIKLMEEETEIEEIGMEEGTETDGQVIGVDDQVGREGVGEEEEISSHEEEREQDFD